MIQFVFGVLILLIPFLLIFTFKNRLEGFLKVFISLGILHTVVVLITQFFHIFDYTILISFYIIFDLICLYIFHTREKEWGIKVSWYFVVVFLLIFIQLYSVRYNYTGDMMTIGGVVSVEDDKNTYPIFSDEWIVADLVDYSINSKSLPVVDTLKDNIPFANFLVVFYSVLAEVVLILGLNPFVDFAVLAILSGLFVCLSVFILLRSIGLNTFVSATTTAFIPLITHSGNLPGLWFLIPFVPGTALFLLSLASFKVKSLMVGLGMMFLSVLVYPPIIVFALPVLLFIIFSHYSEVKKPLGISLGVVIVLLFLSLLVGEKASWVFETFTSMIFRSDLDPGTPAYVVYYIVPPVILILSIIGFWKSFEKKNYLLLIPTITGLVFWFFYTRYSDVVMIEYPRVVMITSILLVVMSGIGLEKSVSYLKEVFSKQDNFDVILKVLFVVIFILITVNYPAKDGWSKFYVEFESNGQMVKVSPAPPINRYIHEDDIKLFSDISGKRFISHQWKGIVLGTMFDNFPLDSKPSVFTNKYLTYHEFMKADCVRKNELAKKYDIEYVYSQIIECDGFVEKGRSREGFVLYSFDIL